MWIQTHITEPLSYLYDILLEDLFLLLLLTPPPPLLGVNDRLDLTVVLVQLVGRDVQEPEGQPQLLHLQKKQKTCNVTISVVDPNTLNLDPDPDTGFWPNLDPDLDPGTDPDPGLCYQF